eukprot:6492899-Karenia_brevis.AAC.1
MRQWFGEQLPLNRSAEEELEQPDRTSSSCRVQLGRRLADYKEPEHINYIHHIDTWHQYVDQ